MSDYVEGLTLGDWLTGQRPTVRRSVELVIKIADALQVAHEAGIVQRDLKPSNIMLDKDNEPHVMDFGLAKREAGEITMTADGQVLGTPAYMSPEQARGDAHTADRRADIYALGVLLFELLTGERPFRGNQRMLLHQLLNEDAPSPRNLNGNVPKDLETVTLKCLEKDPDRRFQQAKELSAELRRYLAGEPIESRPVGFVEHGWRWCKRNPVIASLTAMTTALLLVLGVGGPILATKEARLRTSEAELRVKAERLAVDNSDLAASERSARLKAERQSAELERQLRLTKVATFSAEARNYRFSNRVASLLFGIKAVRVVRDYGEEVPTFAHETLLNATNVVGGYPVSVTDNLERETRVRVSRHNNWLAIRDSNSLRLWDLSNSETTKITEHVLLNNQDWNSSGGIALSDNGCWLAITGSDVTTIYEIAHSLADDEGSFPKFILNSTSSNVTLSPNGRWLLQEDSPAHATQLWDLDAADMSGLPIKFPGRPAFSPDSRWMAIRADENVYLADLSSLESDLILHELNAKGFVYFSMDSKRLLVGDGRKATLWDLTLTSFWNSPQKEYTDVTAVRGEFSPDGRWLFTIGRKAMLWDFRQAIPVPSLLWDGRASAISGSSNAAVTNHGTIARFWDLDNEAGSLQPEHISLEQKSFVGANRMLPSSKAVIGPNKSWFLTPTSDGNILVFGRDQKTRMFVVKSMLSGHEEGIVNAFITSNGKWLVSKGRRQVRLWPIPEEGYPSSSPLVLSGHDSLVDNLVFSADGRRLVSGGGDKTVRVTSLADGYDRPVQVLTGHKTRIVDIAMSASGDWLGTASEESTRLWNLNRFPDSLVANFESLSGGPYKFDFRDPDSSRLAMDPGGRWFACVYRQDPSKVRLVDLTSEKGLEEMMILEGNLKDVSSLAISPDGRWLASASSDNTVRIWDLSLSDPGESSTVLEGHQQPVNLLAFNSDSNQLASASDGFRVKIWDLGEDAKFFNSGTFQIPVPDERSAGSQSKISQLTYAGRKLMAGVTTNSVGTHIRIWDLDGNLDEDPRVLPLGRYGAIYGLAVGSDARWLATTDQNSAGVRLWDLSQNPSGRIERNLTGEDTPAFSLAISPDNRWLAAGLHSGNVRLWHLNLEEQLTYAEWIVGKEFTSEEQQTQSYELAH